MLDKINKLKNWHVALIFIVVGFAVYFTGLNNPFLGDDSGQIVNNVPVHSIRNIKLFFEGGTFYNGLGLRPLSGSYFRPLMTTVFSLIYSIFGAHAFYFHLVQLLLGVGCAFLLYLIFRYSFKPALALFLTLTFLIHPVDSQAIYQIASMQEVLYMFFGLLAIWTLLRFSSLRSLIFVAICLLLSLLAKETGALFVAVALLYIFIWDRKRFYPLIGILLIPIALYMALRVNAIGLIPASNNAPIDNIGLWGRLLTDPSIALLYITKFLLPFKLASVYYWTYPHFSLSNVLLPLLIDVLVLGAIIYVGIKIKKKLSLAQYFTFWFFTAWTLLGFLLNMQIVALDSTASNPWFYFSMIGFLGMIGMIVLAYPVHVRTDWLVAVMVLILVILGFNSAIRGRDWSSQYKLSTKDVAASQQEYVAYKDIAIYYLNAGNKKQALYYASKSVSTFPYGVNYGILGEAQEDLGNYPQAAKDYMAGMKYQAYYPLYQNMAALTSGYGSPAADKKFLLKAVSLFPNNSSMWFYLAILDYKEGDVPDAKYAINQAYSFGQPTEALNTIYYRIMNNLPLNVIFNPAAVSI